MSNLTGRKAEQFVEWLVEARWMLPPKMKISEARELFLRKLKEEEEILNETKQQEDCKTK